MSKSDFPPSEVKPGTISVSEKIASLLDTVYTADNVDYIPEKDEVNVQSPGDCLKFNAAVLYLNTRCNTRVLQKNNKRTAVKIHHAYLQALTEIARLYNGEVKMAGTTGIYVLFTGAPGENALPEAPQPAYVAKKILPDAELNLAGAAATDAVDTALQFMRLFTSRESGLFARMKKYSALEFTIGIDYGNILYASADIRQFSPAYNGQASLTDSPVSQLNIQPADTGPLFIGACMEKPVLISNRIRPPYYVGISRLVYTLLPDDLLADYEVKSKAPSWRSRFFSTTGGLETMYMVRGE